MIAAVHGKSKLVAYLIIMIGIHNGIVVTTIAKLHPCTLIIEWRVGIGIDDTTDTITSVKCALRSTQHLQRRQVKQVVIESRALHVRHAIHIKSHGGTIGLRSYATHKYGRCLSATVFRYIEIWHRVS